jgi:protein-disulfide isomerase
MRRPLADIVLRLAVLVALGVSTALLWDYFRPMPAFCDVGASCDRVRASRFSSLLGVPVPMLGALGFTLIFGLSLGSSSSARRATQVLAIVAGTVGFALLGVQAVLLQMFCRLCVAVDVSALVAAGAALSLGREHFGETKLSERNQGTSASEHASDASAAAKLRPALSRPLWIGSAIAVVVLPGLWSLIQPSPPVPREIARLWRPNLINVVEFADFQCPFCRQLHPVLNELLQEYAGRVHFVRLNMPLPSHSQARDAARAYVCAERFGHGPEMADMLFAADSLSPDGIVAAGQAAHLDPEPLRACMAQAETDARIDEDIRQVKAAGLAGLPTIWIGDQVLVGARPKETLQDAFEAAARGAPTRWPLAWLWTTLAVALGTVAWLAWRAQRAIR